MGRGAFRLWLVISASWCIFVFLQELIRTNSINWFIGNVQTIHVKISDDVTWDYPAEWGVQQIRDDIQKRLASDTDRKSREYAEQNRQLSEECEVALKRIDEAVKAEKRSSSSSADEPKVNHRLPGECNDYLEANSTPEVGSDWELQIPPRPSAVIAAAAPWAVTPPLGTLVLGVSLFWAFAGFRRNFG